MGIGEHCLRKPVCGGRPRQLPARCNAAALLAVLTSAFSAAGCGNRAPESFNRAAVEGTVTLDDEPVDDAIVRFIPTGRTPGPKTFFPVRDGRFQASRADGPPVGTHRVEIEIADEDELAHDDEQAMERLSEMRHRSVRRTGLDRKYDSKSPLTAELAEPDGDGPQSLEFSLSSRGP